MVVAMVKCTALVLTVSLALLLGCFTAMTKQITILSYDGAIEQANTGEGIDRRVELRQCVRNWSDMVSQRRELFETLSLASRRLASPTAVLEIGNAGFPRYDYIYFEGGAVTSTLRPQKQLATGDARTFLEKLSSYNLGRLEGSASSMTDDGDCFFLTVSKEAAVKQVAVYADLDSSAAGLLIRDLLSLVTGEK